MSWGGQKCNKIKTWWLDTLSVTLNKKQSGSLSIGHLNVAFQTLPKKTIGDWLGEVEDVLPMKYI